MIPNNNRNERKHKSLKLAITDPKMAQAGSEIKKWETILNNNCPRDQKEPFLTTKNGEKKERKNNGALIL